jgi:hypothetical protein
MRTGRQWRGGRFRFDGDAQRVIVQAMLQAVAENSGISNSEPKVGLAQYVMNLAVSSKLTDLEEMFLTKRSAEAAIEYRCETPW